MMRFEARSTSYKNDCVLCRRGRGIWRHPEVRRFFICDDCFAADRHRDITWLATHGQTRLATALASVSAARSGTTHSSEETHG